MGDPKPQDLTALRLRYDTAVRGLHAPLAVLDRPAYRANAADLVRRAGGTPIRLATKSLRVRSVIAEVSAMRGYRGLMAYSLREALFLNATDTSDDILVAYPTTDREALADLAADPDAAAAITVMVDCVEHLEMIEDAVQGVRTAPIRVALDMDASWRPLDSSRLHVGVRRSPVRTPEQAEALARAVVRRPALHLDGVMAYEAQIAGVADQPGGATGLRRGVAVRAVQSRSAGELADRRRAVVEAVRSVAPLRFVNGGGTGSIERTTAESVVTEVAAGSGVFAPHLFDAYSSFQPIPAALFALPVVRRPAPGWATLLGGGYLASGPADASRLPQVYLPEGLALSGTEGAGEVQTPVRGAAADDLAVGDLVWLRHAKAGELAERFVAFHVVEGDHVAESVPTYRGEGQCFG
jgi:D-serine deaminase-like pyridoxal phosphate-dependent protein